MLNVPVLVVRSPATAPGSSNPNDMRSLLCVLGRGEETLALSKTTATMVACVLSGIAYGRL